MVADLQFLNDRYWHLSPASFLREVLYHTEIFQKQCFGCIDHWNLLRLVHHLNFLFLFLAQFPCQNWSSKSQLLSKYWSPFKKVSNDSRAAAQTRAPSNRPFFCFNVLVHCALDAICVYFFQGTDSAALHGTTFSDYNVPYGVKWRRIMCPSMCRPQSTDIFMSVGLVICLIQFSFCAQRLRKPLGGPTSFYSKYHIIDIALA